jgi:hypothetical protein
VELLRRRCDVVYCIDASGDPAFSFATLRETMALASLELEEFENSRIDLDAQLQELLPRAGSLPLTNATTFTLRRRGRPDRQRDVAIHYAKLQVTQDMSPALRRYAIADPKFPNYSTAQQFLTPQQFSNLVQAGIEAGDKLLVERRRFLKG